MIHEQLTEQLCTLRNLLQRLSTSQYNRKIVNLGNASIGAHTRHVIELIQCVTNGYENGVIDYHNRLRNMELETNKELALQQLAVVYENIRRSDKVLELRLEKSVPGIETISTTFFRELIYHIEHTIHHQALIKVALREQQLEITDENFGVAYSTIQFRSQQAGINQN